MIAPKYSKRIKKCEFCIFHLLHDSTDWAPSSSENPSDNSHAPSWSCASWVPRLFVSECSLLSWLQLGAGLSPPNPKRRLVIPKLSFHHYVRTKSDKNMFLVYGLKSNRAGELRFWEWGCKMWHRMSPKSHVSSCRPRNLSFSGQDRQLMVCVSTNICECHARLNSHAEQKCGPYHLSFPASSLLPLWPQGLSNHKNKINFI